MLALILFAGGLLASPAVSSPQANPPDLPAAVRRALPAGYKVLKGTQGDLNRDGYLDWAVVLKKPKEEKMSKSSHGPVKRPLLLFVGGPNDTYTLAERCDNAVYSIDAGGSVGDPFQQIVIKDGYISLEHFGGTSVRWSRIITFKYVPTSRTWFLHRDGGDFWAVASTKGRTFVSKTTKDFGQVPFASFDIYKN